MKKTILAVSLAAACLNAWGAGAADPAVWSTPGPALQAQTMLFAGSAPIEQALAVIVPAPWQIDLDSRVDVTRKMSWSSSANWVTALQAACSQMGLVVRIDRAHQTVDVMQASAPGAAEPPPRAFVHTPAPSRIEPSKGVAEHAKAHIASRAAASLDKRLGKPSVLGANAQQWRSFINGGGPMKLSSALLRIMPPTMSMQGTEIVGIDDSQLVAWKAGSRRDALMDLARAAHARIVVSAQGVRMEPATAATRTPAAAKIASKGVPVPVRVAPAEGGIKLVAGKLLGKQLQACGRAQGWTVVWKLDQDWIVPAPASFAGSFGNAAQAVVEALAANGADIRADLYTSNKTLVVHQ